MSSHVQTFRVDDTTIHRLERLEIRLGKSKSDVIRLAIEQLGETAGVSKAEMIVLGKDVLDQMRRSAQVAVAGLGRLLVQALAEKNLRELEETLYPKILAEFLKVPSVRERFEKTGTLLIDGLEISPGDLKEAIADGIRAAGEVEL